jgi:hypothetical protein
VRRVPVDLDGWSRDDWARWAYLGLRAARQAEGSVRRVLYGLVWHLLQARRLLETDALHRYVVELEEQVAYLAGDLANSRDIPSSRQARHRRTRSPEIGRRNRVHERALKKELGLNNVDEALEAQRQRRVQRFKPLTTNCAAMNCPMPASLDSDYCYGHAKMKEPQPVADHGDPFKGAI